MATDLNYQVVEGWEQLPAGLTHKDIVGVGVDSRDLVYLLPRGDPRVIVYEPDGTFFASWAEGAFTNRTCGIRIGPDDAMYLNRRSSFWPEGVSFSQRWSDIRSENRR